MLDDDNLPDTGCYNKLLSYIDLFKSEREKFCLLCNRPSRPQYISAVEHGNSDAVLYARNCFLKYGIGQIVSKTLLYFSARDKTKEYGSVSVGPYGGLVLPVDVFTRVKPPDEKYYLYHDDIDFTYRISTSGYKIYHLKNCIVQDLESSWFQKSGFLQRCFPELFENSGLRLYYSLRNRIYFQNQYRVSFRPIFYFHGFLYISILFCVSILLKKFSLFRIILEALKDGIGGEMGKKVAPYCDTS